MQDRRGLVPLRRARAGLLPPAQRLPLLQQVVADAEAMGLVAHALAARSECVQALVDSGQAAAAAIEAAALLPQVQQRCAWAHPPSVALTLFQALAEPEPALALAQLGRALGWIESAVAELPPALASSLLARHPVNRQVIAAARRHPALRAQVARLDTAAAAAAPD